MFDPNSPLGIIVILTGFFLSCAWLMGAPPFEKTWPFGQKEKE